MKKIISILCAVSIAFSSVILTSCKSAGAGAFDDGKFRKNMTSVQYAEDMGLGINLGNTMDAYWSNDKNKCSGSSAIIGNGITSYETCWGAVKTTQEIIDGMRNAGFDTVRVPVYWGNTMNNDGSFTISDEMFNRVQEIIDYCRKDGLYVVINIHHYDGFLINNYSKDEVIDITKNIWSQIAKRYKDYSDYLIFEGFNESLGSVREDDNFTDDQKYEYVNQMNQTFVDAVRSSGGNNGKRLLIVSGYWTNIDLTTNEKYIIPNDTAKDRIMVSVHYIDNSMYWSNSIGNQNWLDYSKAQCELLKKAFTDKGIPVFIGECTSVYNKERIAADAIYTDSTQCLEVMYNMMLDYGFVSVLWDVNDNFYSRTEYRIKSDSDKAMVEKILMKMIEDKSKA